MEELAGAIAQIATDSSMLSSHMWHILNWTFNERMVQMKRLSETNGRVIVVKMIELQCRTPSEAHRTIDVRHITFYECELHAHCMMDLDMHDVQLHMCNVTC